MYATASLLGLQALFAAVPVLYVLIKAAGGIYLMYIGIRIWRSSKDVLGATRRVSMLQGSGRWRRGKRDDVAGIKLVTSAHEA